MHLPEFVVIDQNPRSVRLIRDCLRIYVRSFLCSVFRDVESVLKWMDWLDGDSTIALPQAVLLNTHFPIAKSSHALVRLRAGRGGRSVPLVMVASSDARKDRAFAGEAEGSVFWLRPEDPEDFPKIGTVLRTLLLSQSHAG